MYANTDTVSPSWDADFPAACEKLTKDSKVVAVLGYIFVWLDAFEGCRAKAGVVHVYDGYQPGDRRAQRDHPLLPTRQEDPVRNVQGELWLRIDRQRARAANAP